LITESRREGRHLMGFHRLSKQVALQSVNSGRFEKSVLLDGFNSLSDDLKRPKFAMDSQHSAVLKAGMICSASGILKFVSSNFSPAPTTGCPALPAR
jgi:hypothetical protein